ncbi:MAG: hypothetical protein KKA56_04430, partial [Gammaproteobacteria bacterium]|nr:hypothetical protein [Gammaproteobacteria bacterium]
SYENSFNENCIASTSSFTPVSVVFLATSEKSAAPPLVLQFWHQNSDKNARQSQYIYIDGGMINLLYSDL